MSNLTEARDALDAARAADRAAASACLDAAPSDRAAAAAAFRAAGRAVSAAWATVRLYTRRTTTRVDLHEFTPGGTIHLPDVVVHHDAVHHVLYSVTIVEDGCTVRVTADSAGKSIGLAMVNGYDSPGAIGNTPNYLGANVIMEVRWANSPGVRHVTSTWQELVDAINGMPAVGGVTYTAALVSGDGSTPIAFGVSGGNPAYNDFGFKTSEGPIAIDTDESYDDAPYDEVTIPAHDVSGYHATATLPLSAGVLRVVEFSTHKLTDVENVVTIRADGPDGDVLFQTTDFRYAPDDYTPGSLGQYEAGGEFSTGFADDLSYATGLHVEVLTPDAPPRWARAHVNVVTVRNPAA